MNIYPIVYQMLSALATAYGPKWEAAKDIAEEKLAEIKERLREVAQAVLDGKITPAEAASFVKDELDLLKSSLLAAQIIVESEAEQAINNAVDVFERLVNPVTKYPEL